MEISQQTKDCLLALMRPAEDVGDLAKYIGLSRVLTDVRSDEGRIAALAFMFEAAPFARYSGPPTPVEQYPDVLEFAENARQALQDMRGSFTTRSQKHLEAVRAQLDHEQPPLIERARRAWPFLAEQRFEVLRGLVLKTMLEHTAFSPDAQAPDPKLLRYNQPEDADAWKRVLWEHRDVTRALRGALRGDVVHTQQAHAAYVLDTIARIPDPHERAIVLGAYLDEIRHRCDASAGIGTILAGLLG